MAYRILAILPARSGSTGLRHKNVRKLDGVPLLVRTIKLAHDSQRRGEDWSVVVSTDSQHYRRLALAAGAEAPFLRPKRLATADSRLAEAVLHALDATEQPERPFDAVLLMSVTTPLTSVGDVRRVVKAFRTGGGPSVATVREDPVAPSWRFDLVDGCLDRRPRRHEVLRRQQRPRQVVLSGALYMAAPTWLRRYRQFVRAGKTIAVSVPMRRSVDIETADDLAWVEFLSRRGSP